MTWVLSDGTEVELGGEVRGATVFAQELRQAIADKRTTVRVDPNPMPELRLDVNEPFLLDRFIRDEGAAQWRPVKVTVVKGPKVERPASIPVYEPVEAPELTCY